MTTKGKILYAEDYDSIRNFLSRLIRKKFIDYELEIFEDGTSLEKRLANGIDGVRLVLTDHNMPGIKGGQIIMKYALKQEFRDIPFIINYADDENIGKELVKNYGAFAYVLKESDTDYLLEKMREALER